MLWILLLEKIKKIKELKKIKLIVLFSFFVKQNLNLKIKIY